jgi:glycosyltransferase involved in cell wall biosynthesis
MKTNHQNSGPTVELTLLLPVYNEALVVAEVVEAHHEALSRVFRSFEIIVIDDGSNDSTSAAARAVAERFTTVRVHRNERNIGQGASLLVGFRLARGEAVLHNAVDVPFAPSEVSIVKRALDEGADVVVVERATRRAYGMFRRVVSVANVLLLRTLFRAPVRDYNFVQAFRRNVLDGVPVTSTAVGTVTPEIIIRAHKSGYKVVTVRAEYHARRVGRSSIRLHHITSSLQQTLALFFSLRRTDLRAATSRAEVRRTGAAADHVSL